MKLGVAAAALLGLTPSISAWVCPHPKLEEMMEKINTIHLVVDNTCGNGTEAQIFQHFNGIFFGDFITSGNGQGSDGPLAIQGNMQGGSYTVNQHGSPACTDADSIPEDGLIVAGEFDVSDAHIFGDTYLSPGSSTSDIQQEVSGCNVYTDRGTGGFDFGMTKGDANIIQILYASRRPTLKIDSNHNLRRVSEPVGGIEVITFNTCDGGCTFYPGQLSDPSGMLFGQNNWNGPVGMSFPEKLVLNIPVTQGSSITFSGNLISSGLHICSTLWNVYPTAGHSGKYRAGDLITVHRETGGRLEGMFLAPLADIYDGPTASFAGQVIGNNYYQEAGGVFLNDFGSCTWDFCLPIIDVVPSDDDPTSSESSSESSSTSHTHEDDPSSESSSESESTSESSSDSSSESVSSESSESSESSDSSSESVSSESSESSESSDSSSESISSESSDSSETSESDSSSNSETESCDEPSTTCTTEHHHHHHHHTEIDCDHGEEDHQHDVVYCEYDDHYHDGTEDCEQDEEVVVCGNKDDSETYEDEVEDWDEE